MALHCESREKLMKTYSLFWTPCAALCVDLIFENIGKKDIVASVIHDVKDVTNFIYNHGRLPSQMREVCKGEIVRPGATRFATNHIALDSLLRKKKDKRKKNIMMYFRFKVLGQCAYVVKKYESLYQVLRLVDTEVVSTMPIVYELMRVIKDAVKQQRGSKWVINIIQDRWDIMLSHPLYAIAVEVGDNNENPIFDWVRPTYLDDDEENHDPHIASQARDIGINVEQVIREEVCADRGVIIFSSSDIQHTSDGNSGGKNDGDDGDGGDAARGWDSGARGRNAGAGGSNAGATS
ncbi:hypothetical protein Ddye_005599 [Dipteronia dyeriana]|uniref:Uncharacterized protein n=1 Tax=Dipteronia dyeriana TaxID=168575 RepID=A0AAE0CPV4_9ROSI|nr:hypothetical protein Ddye_005599 [Dipteronia dyeriana]